MGITSQDYTPYVPEEPVPLSPLVPLSCGDITEVSDFLTGGIESTSAIDQNSNRPVEIHRFTDFAQSSLNIEAIEEVLYDLHKARNAGCMFGVQRRRYCDTDLAEVHHYGWVSVGGMRVSNATAIGINAKGSVPIKSTTGVFGLYHHYDDSGPDLFFLLGWNPLEVTFCNQNNCSPCDANGGACDVIFSLWVNEWNTRQILLSVDGGDIWSQYTYDNSVGGEATIHCHDGCLFIGTCRDEGNVIVIPDSLDPGGPLVFNRIFSLVAKDQTQPTTVVKFASSGHMIYAAWENTERVGVDRSVDGGRTWDTILKADFTEIVDLEAVGPNVAVAVFNSNDNEYGLFAVNDNGNFSSSLETIDVFPRIQLPDTTIGSIALSVPDFTKKDCPVIHLVTKESVIYVGYAGLWERAYQNEFWCDSGSPVHIETSIDGYGVWYNRADIRYGQVITMKNMGMGLDCDWIEHTFNTSVCLLCNQPVACGNEAVARACNAMIATCQCEDCINYPCEDWHRTAFAICPTDPNRAIVLAGTSCLPYGTRRTSVLVKTIEGMEVISKGEECLPPLCD